MKTTKKELLKESILNEIEKDQAIENKENGKKLIMIDLYNDRLDKEDFENLCFSNEEIEEYNNWQFDYFKIFEGDPDYMIDNDWNTIYFIIIWNKVYYISLYDNNNNIEKLENFCKSQDPSISLWWYNTRSENDNRIYFDKNTWDEFWNYHWLKIAYRGGCWYCYTLFKYID